MNSMLKHFVQITLFVLYLNLSSAVLVYEYKNANGEGKILEDRTLVIEISSESSIIQGKLACQIKETDIAEIATLEPTSASKVTVKVRTHRLGKLSVFNGNVENSQKNVKQIHQYTHFSASHPLNDCNHDYNH